MDSAASALWPDGSSDECPECGFLHAPDRSCEDRAPSAACTCSPLREVPHRNCPAHKTSVVAQGDLGRDAVRALDLHKERIRRLQEALCECPLHDLFQADLHDESCPVYVIAAEQREEYVPRV